MTHRFAVLIFVGLAQFIQVNAFGADRAVPLTKKKKETVNVQRVYEDGDAVVIVTDSGTQTMRGNEKITKYPDYEILVDNRPSEYKDLTSDEYLRQNKSQIDKILYEAKLLFESGSYSKCWDLVNAAEELDPKNYQTLSMKGSLLYRVGAVDSALLYYEASLKINDNQIDVAHQLEKIKAEVAAKKTKAPKATEGQKK